MKEASTPKPVENAAELFVRAIAILYRLCRTKSMSGTHPYSSLYTVPEKGGLPVVGGSCGFMHTGGTGRGACRAGRFLRECACGNAAWRADIAGGSDSRRAG